MKRRRSDKILTTAFGDGDALDLNGLTDEERAEFEDARQLSEGLKSLREVPECQLSTERLVAAVLSSAVKKRQTFAWGYAAVAAAFVAMAFFALQPSLFNRGAESAGNVATGLPSMDDGLGPIGVTVPGSPPSTGPPEVEVEPSDSIVTEAGTPPAPMVRDEDALPPDMPVSAGIGGVVANNDALVADTVPATLRADDAAKMTTVSFEAADPEAREPLVIVDSAFEDENGTYVATELETFGDVVFGG